MRKSAKPAADSAAQVRAYAAALSPDRRRALMTLRRIIREIAPDAGETMSYGIPAFKVNGGTLVYLAAWKNHTSLYPIGPALAKACGATGYRTSKGTIQFPLAEPIPSALVKRIVKARLAMMRDGAPRRRR